MFGVDEAGRGPVLGSMFVACVATEDESHLPDGIRDSKRLSKSRIRDLADKIRDSDDIRWSVVEVSIDRIDDPDVTMTDVTVWAFARAIDELGLNGQTGIMDACHPDEDTFIDLVTESVDSTPKLHAEHGADDEYPLVSAASVVAKDARERHMKSVNDAYDVEVGSGYPSDPTTREFLERIVSEEGDLPDCARRSWGTSEDVMAKLS